MCGIVSYFGSAPNPLSRVVTGMSAIIYRAPDSTGVATFGNLSESISIRKNIGSVARLLETLEAHPINTNPDKEIFSLFQLERLTPADMQKKLIEYEQLSPDVFNRIEEGSVSYPTADEIRSLSSQNPVSVTVGCPGRPYRLEKFTIRSRNDLKRVVESMLKTYDLSFVAIKAIFRKQLVYGIEVLGNADLVKADAADIYNAFDHLFQTIFEEYRPYVKRRDSSYKRVHLNPRAKKYLWQLISSIPITVPEDFDRDGISNLFRIIDEAVTSRIIHKPDIADELQEFLNRSLPLESLKNSYNWHALYRAEKGMNVYGRAASAAFEWLRKNEVLKALASSILKGPAEAFSSPEGMTGARGLNYLVQPIITQGRWALQSEVTVKNAHPFIDEKGKRVIALNGQFSTQVEDQMQDFLSNVVKVPFRSNNSSEYFALLWGYYFEILRNEKKQFQEIKDHIEKGLDEYAVGSTSINYQIFKQVQGKTDQAIDEAAFIEAAKRFTKNGGQIAVAGMSIESPRTLYAASSNRPLFIVRRKDTDDYMVVSDINAALGLFPQSEIMAVTRDYEETLRQRDKEIEALKGRGAGKGDMEKCRKKWAKESDKVLIHFSVEVYALEKENVFAKISTGFKNGLMTRDLVLTDYGGNPIRDIEPYVINLTPPHVHKDMDKSFFESHLEEVPDLLENMVANIMDPEADTAEIQINLKKFQRRFGRNLKGVRRVFLLGMGSSCNTAEFAAGFIRKIFQDIQVITAQPVEIELISRTFVPEEDLILLLSWSATTAETVKFAKELEKRNIHFIGITEKTFGDMALMARKSLGVVYAGSGEEVTVPAVKSTFCMFMCINMLSLYLYRKTMGMEIDWQIMGSIVQVPHLVKHVLSDNQLKENVRNTARKYADMDIFFVVDALFTTPVGREAVFKMEEMTWYVAGKAVDYADVEMNLFRRERRKNLVVVNATCGERLGEAVSVMEALYSNSIEFIAVTFDSPERPKIEKLSRGNLILLPKTDDCFQPFIDVAFYYLFAFYSGQVRGHQANEYPRNRAKSVTTSRSVDSVEFSVQGEYYNLRHKEAFFKQENEERPPDFAGLTVFEKGEFTASAKTHFDNVKKLGGVISDNSPFNILVEYKENDHSALADFMFGQGGETDILFIPVDSFAEAASGKVAAVFQRYLLCTMRVAKRSELLPRIKEDTVCLLVSSGRRGYIAENLERLADKRTVWFGCTPPADDVLSGIPCYSVKEPFRESCDDLILYTALSLMFINAFSMTNPERGELLSACFKRSGHVIHSVLNDAALCETVQKVVTANREYKSLLFLSPPDGTGLSFINRFNSRGLVLSAYEPFGSGAHGPLVTVDNRVEAKFVRIEKRETMVEKYGEENVGRWEKMYITKGTLDSFPEYNGNELSQRVNTPFFAEGEWYLPVLRPDYPVSRDNLILLDATNERYLDHAADDLAVFGCRHARVVVITQDFFLEMPEKVSFLKFPVSGMLTIPSFKGADQKVPVSDFHIPFAMGVLATALSGSTRYDT